MYDFEIHMHVLIFQEFRVSLDLGRRAPNLQILFTLFRFFPVNRQKPAAKSQSHRMRTHVVFFIFFNPPLSANHFLIDNPISFFYIKFSYG